MVCGGNTVGCCGGAEIVTTVGGVDGAGGGGDDGGYIVIVAGATVGGLGATAATAGGCAWIAFTMVDITSLLVCGCVCCGGGAGMTHANGCVADGGGPDIENAVTLTGKPDGFGSVRFISVKIVP